MPDTLWFDAAEKGESEVNYHAHPEYVVQMALAEQQKRTADALEQIVELLGHITARYV